MSALIPAARTAEAHPITILPRRAQAEIVELEHARRRHQERLHRLLVAQNHRLPRLIQRERNAIAYINAELEGDGPEEAA